MANFPVNQILRYFEKNFDVNSDEDGEDDLMPFDQRAEQMFDIIDDGGVKKKVSISSHFLELLVFTYFREQMLVKRQTQTSRF